MRSLLLLSVFCVGQWSTIEDGNQWNSATTSALTYTEGLALSQSTGKMLMVYVGLKSSPQKNAIACEVQSLEGYPEKCVVLSRPDVDGNFYWLKTFDQNGLEIKEAVKPSASPFDLSLSNSREQLTTVQRDASQRSSGLRFNASHNCPDCGRSQFIVSGRGPGGTHTHTCSRCGTSWYH